MESENSLEANVLTKDKNNDNVFRNEIREKLSESENEMDDIDGNFNFDDLYNKVFEDINNDHQEMDKMKVIKCKRRRGRPRQNHGDDEDDPDSLYDELDFYENRATSKQKLQNEQQKSPVNDGGESNANKKPQRRRGPPTKYSTEGPPFECEICHLQCKNRLLLNSHRFRKHRPLDDPQFGCNKCDRMFHTKQSLDRHMRRPTCDAYPQFECEHCGKKCIGLSNYNIHLRFHKRQYPFVCHLCGKKFMMRVHLNEHVTVKHENKRYPCEYPGCGKLFQTRNSLYNHSYQHTGVMPYECEYCKRGYASKSRLRYHCKKSHSIDHTIEELDRMQVTEKLPKVLVKAQ